MHISILLGDNVGSQLLNGIFSLQFLQFIIAFLSFFGFVLTSAVISREGLTRFDLAKGQDDASRQFTVITAANVSELPLVASSASQR